MSDYRIYVASLSDYNSGNLHGAWIDCDGKDADELQADVSAMLRESRFPNVTVGCPDCAGPASWAGLADPAFTPCGTCKGSGKVASAEEYAIHDHEGFGDLVGEYTPISEVAGIVEALESADDADALREFADCYGYDIVEAASQFEDAYRGQWDSEREYALTLLESMDELASDSLASRYFDYDAFTRDLFMFDCTRTDSGHVFDDNH